MDGQEETHQIARTEYKEIVVWNSWIRVYCWRKWLRNIFASKMPGVAESLTSGEGAWVFTLGITEASYILIALQMLHAQLVSNSLTANTNVSKRIWVMTLGKALWIKSSWGERNCGLDIILLQKHWWHSIFLLFMVINLCRTLLISTTISSIRTDPIRIPKILRLIVGQLSILPLPLLPGRVSICVCLRLPILHRNLQQGKVSWCSKIHPNIHMHSLQGHDDRKCTEVYDFGKKHIKGKGNVTTNSMLID